MKYSSLLLIFALVTTPATVSLASDLKFNFSSVSRPGFQSVRPSDIKDASRPFGFLKGNAPDGSSKPTGIDSARPFVFGVSLPEGNYNVTVTLGGGEATSTTVKAESRQLELLNVETAAGKSEPRTFTVNVRQPKFPGGQVSINSREQGPPVAPRWDDMLTLEFNGKRPTVAALQILPAPEAATLFLAGDSTVTDQPNEPWAGWGQMLPSFFAPGLAVANHAESGLALYSFLGQKRLDKILKTMKKGDYLFIQFGHNDQKDKTPGSGPFTSYKTNLKKYVSAFRAKGGIPVLVTPMERRRWSPDGKPQPTLADYAEAVRQVGKEENVPVIDLNAMSLKLYAALGPEGSKKAFVHYPANSFPGQDKPLKDDTHHNSYGGYELAKCVVEGIKSEVPELAKHLRPGLPTFDPSHPDPAETFAVPASGSAVVEKPAGN